MQAYVDDGRSERRSCRRGGGWGLPGAASNSQLSAAQSRVAGEATEHRGPLLSPLLATPRYRGRTSPRRLLTVDYIVVRRSGARETSVYPRVGPLGP